MCQRTERQSEEDLPHDDYSAAYVDFTGDVERCSPMRLLQDNKSGVYVDLINDGGESALYVDLINDTETMTMLKTKFEQRMCADDRKVYVWARHLENCGGKGTVAELIMWMNTEMKSRMRRRTPLRSTGLPTWHHVIHFGSDLNAYRPKQVSYTSADSRTQVTGWTNARGSPRLAQRIG